VAVPIVSPSDNATDAASVANQDAVQLTPLLDLFFESSEFLLFFVILLVN
jgi:hypothetical protein